MSLALVRKPVLKERDRSATHQSARRDGTDQIHGSEDREGVAMESGYGDRPNGALLERPRLTRTQMVQQKESV
jgi:hypothetical protein